MKTAKLKPIIWAIAAALIFIVAFAVQTAAPNGQKN